LTSCLLCSSLIVVYAEHQLSKSGYALRLDDAGVLTSCWWYENESGAENWVGVTHLTGLVIP
jgi:hypothetical protein